MVVNIGVPVPAAIEISDPNEGTIVVTLTGKRSPNSFMIWSSKRRLEMCREAAGTKMPEASKVLSEEWKNMSPERKEIYVRAANLGRILQFEMFPDRPYYQPPRKKKLEVAPSSTKNPPQQEYILQYILPAPVQLIASPEQQQESITITLADFETYMLQNNMMTYLHDYECKSE